MKKLLSMVMILTLVGSIFTACGNKEEASGDGGKKPELRQLGFKKNIDPNADPVAKYLEQVTGYKVSYEALPIENDDDKLNLLMANKEPYDILKINGSQYNRLASQGALEPLDELLDKYGQTLKAVNKSETFENAKIDGKIYGIPENHPRTFVGNSLAVRQDLLDELGMQVPTTTDELYNLLKAVKEKKGIIPFSGYDGIVYTIAGAFGVITPFEEADGKLQHRLDNAGMKQYLEFMNKLYEEGLLDQEWPVNKEATVQEKFAAGKAAVITYGWGMASKTKLALEKTFPNTEITVIGALKGPDGKIGNWAEGGGVSWYIAIPKWSKHKEEAMKYLNMKVQPDIFKGLSIGEEGVNFKVDNGQLSPILPKFNEDRGNADWFITSTDVEAYKEYWLLRLRRDEVMFATFNDIQKQADVSKQDPTLFAPPMDVVGNNLQKLTKMENDYLIKVIAGAEQISGYDQFLQQWKLQGGSDVLTAYNEWFAKSKK